MSLLKNIYKTCNDSFFRTLRLRAGGAVKRWHTHPTIGEQRVDSHSHAVACLLLALNPNCSLNLIKAALFHDLAEFDIGDIPANVKWAYPAIANSLAEAETEIESKLHIRVELTSEEQQWLRFADTVEYCLYALEQRQLGNMHMDIVFARGMDSLGKAALLKEQREFVVKMNSEYHEIHTGAVPYDLSVCSF